jgi:hypothetical protein
MLSRRRHLSFETALFFAPPAPSEPGLGLAPNVVFLVATDLLQPAVHGTLFPIWPVNPALIQVQVSSQCSNEF